MEALLWIVAVLVALGVGWWAGRGRREDPAERLGTPVRELADTLRRGTLPAGAPALPGGDELIGALREGWQPRNEGREEALRQALGRIAAFLREGVRDPLRRAAGAGPAAQREAMETAVGAVRDLEFFLREPLTPDEVHNLVPVVQQVTREFAQDWDIAVRMRAADRPVRAHIHRDTFMDAIYLLLHNAGQFGGAGTIDVTVGEEEGAAIVVVRDRGPGFTDEALRHAHDLFWTTTDTGLGLGIPFARRIVEGFGGDLELRNAEGGGAEVRLILPPA